MASLVLGSMFSRRIHQRLATRAPVRRRFRLGIERLEDRLAPAGLPTVTLVSPDGGPSSGGTDVTIGGTNFVNVLSVDFGPNNPATGVIEINSTTIQCFSPSGTGTVDVTVTTSAGTSPTNAPTDQFTYETSNTPMVTGVSPNSGPVAGGTTVTITGTDFTGVNAVDFGTTPATSYTFVNSTEITATSPATTTAGPVDVTVTTPAGTSPKNPPVDHFTYVAAASPVVTGVSPNSGPVAGGTTVTITGNNLDGATTVYFGSVPQVNFTVDSDTSITVTSPQALVPGPVDVTVVTPNGTSPTSPSDVFTYIVAPTVTGLNPNFGPTSGGTTVTITGTDFTGAGAVDFGTTPAASFSVVSSTTITAVSPPGDVAVNVTVTTPGGTSPSSSAGVFTYIQTPPTVTAISPQKGPTGGGTLVTITGTGFRQSGTVTVFFGGREATNVAVVNPTTITAVSPAGTGSVDVVVYVNDVGSATSPADVFTYTTTGGDGPRVISVVRYGYHRQATYLVITFNMPLDLTSAQLASNYAVVQSAIGGVTGQTIPLKSATYNAVSNSVTLAFRRRLLLHKNYTLTINGTTPSGVKDLGGLLLDGAGTGQPGSNYVAVISQYNLAGPAGKRPRADARLPRIKGLIDRVAGILRPQYVSQSRPPRSASAASSA